MRLRWTGLAMAAAVVAMLGAAPVARGALKVGMVDTVEVMNNYERTKDASADLEAEMAALKAQAQPKISHIEALRVERDGFNRDSQEWKDRNDEAMKAEIELRNWLGFEQAKIEQRHRDVLLSMYRDIQKVVAAVAKENGLDLVFTKAFLSPPQIDLDQATGIEDLKNRIMGQRIMFPTDVEDLTKEVLTRLNDQYRATKPTPAPAGSAPQG